MRHIPGGVRALGFVSTFSDASSEMIHSLLPIFLVTVLGVSATAIGTLEGIAEATVLVVKMFSGTLSDWFGRRKGLTVVGYGMAATIKPLFALANSFGLVFTARVVDRVGKGIRGAPRDALVADLVPKEQLGASYGLRQSLDTVGAVAGPLVATLLMLRTGDHFRLVFWLAVLPALISVVILVFFVHEPAVRSNTQEKRPQLRVSNIPYFSPAYWAIVVIGAVFTLARFSEAFLVLRASQLGMENAYVPLVMVVMNVTYALSAYPAGWLSDRTDRRFVLAAGAAVLIVSDLILAAAKTIPALLVGIALWGLHMGLSQGLFATIVADTAPMERRGTAFGLFSLVSGIALFAASVLAGELWDRLGAASTFYVGAGFAGFSGIGLLFYPRTRREPDSV
jgi:MFS family permease